jgi:hypothetical protein
MPKGNEAEPTRPSDRSGSDGPKEAWSNAGELDPRQLKLLEDRGAPQSTRSRISIEEPR